jgi:hypothetical protein
VAGNHKKGKDKRTGYGQQKAAVPESVGIVQQPGKTPSVDQIGVKETDKNAVTKRINKQNKHGYSRGNDKQIRAYSVFKKQSAAFQGFTPPAVGEQKTKGRPAPRRRRNGSLLFVFFNHR